MTYDKFHDITGYYPEELLGSKDNWKPYLEELEDMSKENLLEKLRTDLDIEI